MTIQRLVRTAVCCVVWAVCAMAHSHAFVTGARATASQPEVSSVPASCKTGCDGQFIPVHSNCHYDDTTRSESSVSNRLPAGTTLQSNKGQVQHRNTW